MHLSARLYPRLQILLLLCAFFAGSIFAAENAKPKYVFLMIGDGMGPAQRAVAEMYKTLQAKVERGNEAGMLLMNRFPVKGFTTTHPDQGTVTDSAAAATALACGKKTRSGRISMSSDASERYKSVAYYAKDSGMKVGIVSNVPIDHATPAAFYACDSSRGNCYEIAVQAASSGFNYFAGQSFTGDSDKYRKDRKRPSAIAKEAGYTLYREEDGLQKIAAGDDRIIWTARLQFVIYRKDDEIVRLADLTRKGIEVLDNKDGFFMMVEGGKIDWAGHANDLASNIQETLDFDDAVQVAYEFYQMHPKETLIVVTGDHECGGMKTGFDGGFSPEKFVEIVGARKTSVKSFSDKLEGWKKEGSLEKNVCDYVAQKFGITDLTDNEEKDLRGAIAYMMNDKTVDERSEELKQMYGTNNMVVNVCQALLARRCGVMWTSFSHTATAVATTAVGVGSKAFEGKTDNTDIANRLIEMVRRP